MQSLTLKPQAATNEPLDPAAEVLRLEKLLAERQVELTTLQEELLRFKARYTQIVGSRLAELAEVEQAIKAAEAHLNVTGDDAPCEDDVDGANGAGQKLGAAEKLDVGGSLRKLFWSVAKLFHPDHAADETEARRRHQIMVEASRAYREGDAESLSKLLGDEELQFYCTGAQATDNPEDLASRLLSLKEELRTVEFGIKRLTQDGLYRIKISAEREAAEGRDALNAEAARINRQITKARHRLTNLTS
jgi:hypothetical protein